MTSVAGAHVRLLTLTWCYCYNVDIFTSNFALWIYIRQFFPSLFSFKVCFGNWPSFEFVHGNQCCVQILVWNDTSVLQHFICCILIGLQSASTGQIWWVYKRASAVTTRAPARLSPAAWRFSGLGDVWWRCLWITVPAGTTWTSR